jgi:polyisoprenyl-phosphate glycosyltransferase
VIGAAVDARLLVLIPIFDDWTAADLLLAEIDRALDAANLHAAVWLVDDGSIEPAPAGLATRPYQALTSISVLALRTNLGHQRAIAIGLAAAHEQCQPSAVVVMDGDGEDGPDDIPRLVAALRANGERKIVFAERRRRTENALFKAFYAAYRAVHLLLTGIAVRVGNFSIIPAAQLDRLVVISELWNHYAAAVLQARLPHETIPAQRRKRLSGVSHMNFTSLVLHGLRALSVYSELIGVRLLVVAMIAAAVLIGSAAMTLALGISPASAVPGWALVLSGLVALLLFQTLASAVVFVFLVLHGRSQPLFIPLRDHAYFVRSLTPLFEASTRPASSSVRTRVPR